MQVPHHAYHGFLSAIFGIFTLSQHAHAESEHRSLKPLYKVDLRGGLPGDTTSNEISQFISQNCNPWLILLIPAGNSPGFSCREIENSCIILLAAANI